MESVLDSSGGDGRARPVRSFRSWGFGLCIHECHRKHDQYCKSRGLKVASIRNSTRCAWTTATLDLWWGCEATVCVNRLRLYITDRWMVDFKECGALVWIHKLSQLLFVWAHIHTWMTDSPWRTSSACLEIYCDDRACILPVSHHWKYMIWYYNFIMAWTGDQKCELGDGEVIFTYKNVVH